MNETDKLAGGGAQRSGSDTLSAARNPANPPQSATLAAHTSKPLGGHTTTGAAAGQSSGPEHLRHQDKDAGQGAADAAKRAASAASDSVRQAGARAQDRASGLYDEARDMAEEAADWASRQAERGSRQLADVRRRGMQTAAEGQRTVERFINENPVLVGVVGLAAGLLVGALLPRTRREDRTFGAWADEVRGQGLRYAREVTQRGREYVEHALGDEEDEERQGPQARPQTVGAPQPRPGTGGGPRSGPAGRYQNH